MEQRDAANASSTSRPSQADGVRDVQDPPARQAVVPAETPTRATGAPDFLAKTLEKADFEETPLRDVLAFFQSRADLKLHVFAEDAALKDAPVSFTVTSIPLWQALKIAAKTADSEADIYFIDFCINNGSLLPS